MVAHSTEIDLQVSMTRIKAVAIKLAVRTLLIQPQFSVVLISRRGLMRPQGGVFDESKLRFVRIALTCKTPCTLVPRQRARKARDTIVKVVPRQAVLDHAPAQLAVRGHCPKPWPRALKQAALRASSVIKIPRPAS